MLAILQEDTRSRGLPEVYRALLGTSGQGGVKSELCILSLQELHEHIARVEAEKQGLHDTLVTTEALIKQARSEHRDEVHAAATAARAEVQQLHDNVNELRVAVRHPPLRLHAVARCVHELNLDRFKVIQTFLFCRVAANCCAAGRPCLGSPACSDLLAVVRTKHCT